MKKTIIASVIIGLLIGFVVPLLVAGQATAPDSCVIRKDLSRIGLDDCPAPGNVANFELFYGAGVGQPTPDATHKVGGGMCCLFNTVLYATDWIFIIILAIVIIFVLMGAFTLLTSAGSDEKVNTGRNYIIFALIGLGAALLARAFPYILRTIMGV
ncbi:hypothetical protein J7K24_00220 [bacterium]|nr:hypothetical protein [bacterium]